MTEPEQGNANTIKELGLSTGLNARNPLDEYTKAFGDSVDQDVRKQFLEGYLEGATKFFVDRGLVVPIGSHIGNIVHPRGLHGFIKGLNRENPNNHNPTVKDDSEAAVWEYTLDLISDHLFTDGYFLGFMIGLARDYDLNLNQVEVPKDAEQYALFNRGLNAQPRTYSPLIGANFAFKGDQIIVIKLESWIYEGGLKLWLHQQGLDVGLADKISHPETLDAFKVALDGKQVEAERIADSPQDIGYRLGLVAREQLRR